MTKRTILFFFFLISWLNLTTYGQKTQVDALVKNYYAKKHFNGSVLIARNGKIDYLAYLGLANRSDSIKYSAKSKFHIFSVTKTFTAVLIMQLYEAGKIHLDSSIATYYPDYKGEVARKATIRNLLTYSSGRANEDMQSIAEAYNTTVWPLDSFITRYCSDRLVTTPGTMFRYNNGDFILLGKIIEHLYGEPYPDILRKKILIPLKMHNTNYLRHEDIIAHLDQAYFHHDTIPLTFYRPTNYYIDNYFSAGAMYSTPTDLLLFDQALFTYKLLKKETVQLMLTSYPHLGDVALGFWVYPKKIGHKKYRVAERQGYGYGHHSNWVHLPDEQLTLILFSNTNTVDLNQMRWEVLATYLKDETK
ncbi:serine hydrolase [Siphonobacter sp. SORGH_AS_1065]|uniref:serine hydrolase domain-containing protein n=1 Tax=Siphonobacter sp. SORGH_AS_1065 TaxID=3041795 RepID=UPI0027894540|nr:serine hydrolase domain-containing protein [Siphonobacter sp. SORGH_AS_1065]MDQ1089848.1 CubicO group peptidase (beta-lactamase class C family) [Siphonobacter sp. SORGH_AS_1065]